MPLINSCTDIPTHLLQFSCASPSRICCRPHETEEHVMWVTEKNRCLYRGTLPGRDQGKYILLMHRSARVRSIRFQHNPLGCASWIRYRHTCIHSTPYKSPYKSNFCLIWDKYWHSEERRFWFASDKLANNYNESWFCKLPVFNIYN